ncbi:hypothetical protein BOTBODRAFT_504183 [Botryobasidium botryosum FD-172 SS1]|uniref:Elongator complex protein 2 n=1 Tax=Botryobasidium botryosum (strain FD-172 SS1) TaxID=930990 RepID=A0A067MEL7_BOTB1|nr:hypothetical protein BOTBODRAFT_504183 [Botryobasidium botryosum FD-172 SS1]
MAHATSLYISASANRHPHAASVHSASSLVAFGSQNAVALWDSADVHDKGIFQTLPGHNAEVTCVKWLETRDALVSADEKGVIRLWRRVDNQWISAASVEAHSRSISALGVHDGLILSGASDATLKAWEIIREGDKESFGLYQTIDMKRRFPLAIELSRLPASEAVIMAVASTDRDIKIFTRTPDGQFTPSLTVQGHEDWVRCLAFSLSAASLGAPSSQTETLTLASGSQDGYTRLWVINPENSMSSPSTAVTDAGKGTGEPEDDLLDAFERSLGELGSDGSGGKQISNRSHLFGVPNADGSTQRYTLVFDALLIGHEGTVTSVSWRPSSPHQLASASPTLLTTSTDGSLILWSPTSPSTSAASLWINRQRFGDIGGGKIGGFVGAFWGSAGKEVMGWGWGGGWKRWREKEKSEKTEEGQRNSQAEAVRDNEEGEADAVEVEVETWEEHGAVTGHQGPVKGIAWDPSGSYIISASLDQTTRIHGLAGVGAKDGKDEQVWHELARPQIHGYDLVGVVWVDPLRFVSIADEKVARVFDAPGGFIRTLKGLGVGADAVGSVDEHARPVAASLPPLGLSNKAITEDADNAPPTEDAAEAPVRSPFEGELASATLWPEIEKVFGHGYELISIAASKSGKRIATACKATTPEHAVVRVYETHEATQWRPLGEPLAGHTLTVTRIAFSPDERFVLSASRDRTWRIFEVQEGFAPAAAEKAHARIIWDCAWTHENDGIFATASRDKTVKIWQPTGPGSGNAERKWKAIATIKTREAATAVDFLPIDVKTSRRRMAIGLETGEVLIYRSPREQPEKWEVELALDTALMPVDQVHRLTWRPPHRDVPEGVGHLAICSEDRSLRIISVVFSPE